jgi:CRISPR/Cas system-associated endonuclease Cas1
MSNTQLKIKQEDLQDFIQATEVVVGLAKDTIEVFKNRIILESVETLKNEGVEEDEAFKQAEDFFEEMNIIGWYKEHICKNL